MFSLNPERDSSISNVLLLSSVVGPLQIIRKLYFYQRATNRVIYHIEQPAFFKISPIRSGAFLQHNQTKMDCQQCSYSYISPPLLPLSSSFGMPATCHIQLFRITSCNPFIIAPYLFDRSLPGHSESTWSLYHLAIVLLFISASDPTQLFNCAQCRCSLH